MLQEEDEGDEDGYEAPAAAPSVPCDAQQAAAAAAQAPPRRGDRHVRVSACLASAGANVSDATLATLGSGRLPR